MSWAYFQPSEVVGLDLELVAMLDMARHKSGVPFIITDGLRSGSGKQDRNAVNNSAHLTGNAVDLRCRDSQTLWKMLSALYASGFVRIGIYFSKKGDRINPTHIHVDNAPDKPQKVVWLTEEL